MKDERYVQAIHGPNEPDWQHPDDNYFIPIDLFPSDMILNENPIKYSKKFKKICKRKHCKLQIKKLKKLVLDYKKTLRGYKMTINRLKHRKCITMKKIIRKKK